MFLDKLFQAIGSLFTNLFNSARKTWKKLSPEIQNAMLHGSAIVETVNANVEAAPEFVIQLIQSKFPDLTREKMLAGLQKVSEGLKIAEGINNDDLEGFIKALQTYLGGLKGKVWAAISHSIASIIAIAVAPAATKFAQIASLMEYCFHAFIKGKLDDKIEAE